MKNWLDRMKGIKGLPWLLLLAACGCALLLFPASASLPSGMTEEEQRVSAFGGGSRTPVGAVIVARGAGDVGVRLDLIRAAETLLGLDARQVDVFPMEENP